MNIKVRTLNVIEKVITVHDVSINNDLFCAGAPYFKYLDKRRVYQKSYRLKHTIYYFSGSGVVAFGYLLKTGLIYEPWNFFLFIKDFGIRKDGSKIENYKITLGIKNAHKKIIDLINSKKEVSP
jgi:hypothetical protein